MAAAQALSLAGRAVLSGFAGPWRKGMEPAVVRCVGNKQTLYYNNTDWGRHRQTMIKESVVTKCVCTNELGKIM